MDLHHDLDFASRNICAPAGLSEPPSLSSLQKAIRRMTSSSQREYMTETEDWPAADEPGDIFPSRSETRDAESSTPNLHYKETLVEEQIEIVDLTLDAPVFKLDLDCIDLTGLPLHRPQSPSSSESVPQVVIENNVYREGMSLLLCDKSYLRIEHIVQGSNGIFFHGRRLFATSDPRMDRYLPKKAGELIWTTHYMEPVSFAQVNRACRVLFTNFRTLPLGHTGMVCRLKLTIRTREDNPTDDRQFLNAQDSSIEYLHINEVDQGFGLSPTELRDRWRGRGQTVPFGESQLSQIVMENSPMDVDQPRQVIDLTAPTRTYTFGDAFCGGGGVSCGAKKAGLNLRWAFDKDRHAINTYQRNFDGVTIENAEIFDFLTNHASFLRVDVCHCSPPCQTFSPAHTVHCDRDEANSACIFSANDLIKQAHPRILTMEETSGLLERHKDYFNRIILNLLDIGYSVRWAVLDCVNYGVPQSRKRLIIIASGPGEALPEMPLPTHGLPGSGLDPLNTIHDSIHDLPPDAPDHDVQTTLERYRTQGWRDPYNAHQPARTVTCSGGEFNYHPSGKRGFTTREFACLQTFPRDFEFSEKNIRRQIGNAVPPMFAAAIYREIAKSLRKTDEQEEEEMRAGLINQSDLPIYM